MNKIKKPLKCGALWGLIFFAALVGITQGAYPPPVDMSVNKEAQVNGIEVQEVNPGETFYYNITVTNNDLNFDAPEVVVTDKLPYDVVYVETNVYPALPTDYVIQKTGDLLYVKFEEIPRDSVRYVNITVVAPVQAPTTLYNIANVRYANDPDTSDNSMTISTYVPLVGYEQTAAVKSFEDLLHNQSQLLFDFEDLLHEIPDGAEENYTFIASFEQLLRSQANLTHSFEDLLSNDTQDGWDTYYTPEERVELLESFQAMLWDEAFLFSSFEMKLKDAWASLGEGYTAEGHTQDAQTEFIASFEDLLKEQTKLFKSYELLFKKIGDEVIHEDQADFLAAYENLLRVEANLLMSFEDLLKMKYETT